MNTLRRDFPEEAMNLAFPRLQKWVLRLVGTAAIAMMPVRRALAMELAATQFTAAVSVILCAAIVCALPPDGGQRLLGSRDV